MSERRHRVDDHTQDAAHAPTLSDPTPTTGDHPGGPRRHETPFPAVAEAVRPHMIDDASGHDMHHVWRVFRLGVRIADELDADEVVVGCAALTHDLHRVLDEGTGCDPEETIPLVERLLEEAGLATERIAAVSLCVASHDDLGFKGEDPQPATLEAEILRDADNLDAMGAMGIARTFAFGGVYGTPMWDHEGHTYSQLYHFEDKLLRLRDELHTEPARRLASERHRFLETFVDRFLDEWHGRA
ncbi:MAG: HD domain-containing protein [Halobacteriota archaeon]